jgi:hypothetical protein
VPTGTGIIITFCAMPSGRPIIPNTMKAIVLSVVALFVWLPVVAQDEPIKIYVSHSGSDQVGQQLVYEIREELRRSSGLSLAREGEASNVDMRITTIESNRVNPGASTTYAVVWLIPSYPFPAYLTSVAGYCGSSRIRECAHGLVADTDRAILDARAKARPYMDN